VEKTINASLPAGLRPGTPEIPNRFSVAVEQPRRYLAPPSDIKPGLMLALDDRH